MGFFTRAAMDALMKTTHPEINRRQCWNLHPHRKSCTACKDICPYGDQIFTRPNLVKDWDPCTDCGLCVSVCRSRCISPSPEQVERDTSAADTDNDTIWIGCEKSARKNSMVRACIASLSWEALAYLALNKKIVLDLTPCGECENDTCADQLRAELTRLVEFFGETMFEARFTLAYEPDEAPYHVKELTRREMFEQVGHGSKSGTKQLLRMLPGLRSDEDGGADFRLLLHQRTRQLKAAMPDNPLHYGCYLPSFTDKCVRCVRGGLLQQGAGRHEAAPAHHPWPGEPAQVHQDPVQELRQAHCSGQRRGPVLGVPHQGAHQTAAGRSPCPRTEAQGRAGGQKGRRGSRQGGRTCRGGRCSRRTAVRGCHAHR